MFIKTSYRPSASCCHLFSICVQKGIPNTEHLIPSSNNSRMANICVLSDLRELSFSMLFLMAYRFLKFIYIRGKQPILSQLILLVEVLLSTHKKFMFVLINF